VIATLRSLVAAQAQFQQGARADEDQDGTGEYGGFLELSGSKPGRLANVLVPPVLSGAFRALTANAEAPRSGYLFKIYLPSAAGAGVGEHATDGYVAGAGQSPDLSETSWCCYAWPVNYAHTHGRTFFTNQGGDILVCEVPGYSGSGGGPAADSAFAAVGTVTGALDIGGPGQNPGGQRWRQIP
jgi:hypothetical protein